MRAWLALWMGRAQPRHPLESSGNFPPCTSQQERTRTNENNSIRVTLVKWKWNSYPKVVPPCLWSILQQRIERESVCSCNQTWVKIQRKPEQECVRGSVSGCLSMRELNTPLGLYLKKLGECTRGETSHNGQVAVGKGGAQELLALGRPAPGWAPWSPHLARCFLNGYELWKYGARPKVCSKRCPNYFSQRIKNSENIVGIFSL